MAATTTMATAVLNTKLSTKPTLTTQSKPTKQQISLLSIPKPLTISAPSPLTSTAVAGAIFSALSTANPAFAAQQLADIADGDNRGLALLLPLVPAILWVLYNILQPALNQLNRMRSKGVIIGLSGLAASGFLHPSEAAAAVAEAGSDNRGTLLLFVVAPAIAWVLYNILQPALNQLNRMRSD